MSDLISRNALLDAMPKNDELLSVDVRRIICESPIIDTEPVRHGRWKVFYENLQEQLSGCQCSVCGYTFFGRISDSYNFCPRCGAKMDEGGQNATN